MRTAAATLGEEWSRLAQTSGAPPSADPIWQQVHWEAFRAEGPNPRVHVLRSGEGVRAVITVRPKARVLRRWSSGVNSHTLYGTFALDGPPQTAVDALDHLMTSAHMLDLGPFYARGPATGPLVRAARQRKFHVSEDAHPADAVIDLPASWAELKQSLGTKLVGNTSRALRQLERLGRLEFEVVTGGSGLQPVLAECFTLETLGWKGQHGAPIRSRPDTQQFYSELAEAAAAAGRLAVYTLRLNSTLIAFEYCFRHNGRMDLLKLSYHPDFGRYSPCNVLRFLILEREIESRGVRSYHMGKVSEWKERWATRLEPVCRLRIYSPGILGTVAYLVRSWIPGRARQHPFVRSAARRLLDGIRALSSRVATVTRASSQP